ncbi:heme-binding protein [Bradyrhizobium sp. C-145]|uniref:heme-binding protein n=1 Tax=Bradyrhizobium sp. C-145 TaxID=574727 RepID=UPI00201B8EC0|nr:heme-binding protein [Bradyrhizobium sp. C-145]UQR61459.1 heme-binding protein [Bradyrhizobium sp. C-145]
MRHASLLKAFMLLDGASQMSLSIAQDKAYTSAATGVPTHRWHDFIKGHAPLLHGIVHSPRLVV